MRCLIRSHHQDYKLPLPHEEGEAGGSLEPDPRYGGCCSAVCRPGYALRDALLGLLVLLGLAVVVTVIFVVCFYVLPDEKHLIEEGLLASTAEGIIREPVEVNEIQLKDGDTYNLADNDHRKSTAGRSQDFNTFSTTANFADTTTQLSSADASQFTVFQDVVSPSRNAGRKPGLQGRENLEEDNFHDHREGQNDRKDRHNLGHKGERPILEGESDQFQGEGSRNEEEIDFFADLKPQSACGPVQLPMCISAVPWNMAGKPNWLGHLADQDVFASLATVRRLLVASECSALAPLYACTVLEPPCRDSRILPPCRNFCLDVSRSCPVPASSGIAAMFDCEKFPDSSDPNVCVSAEQECSGEDDFQCATTGLCVPSSWLCDGADDCRDNSDEQNCPLRRAGFGPVTNVGTIGHPERREDGPTQEQFDPSGSENNEPSNTSGPAAGAEVRRTDNVPKNYRETSKPDHNSQAASMNNQDGDEFRNHNREGVLKADVPPFAYDEYDSSNPLVYNDPALVGPSLGDPTLLDASRHPDFNVNNDKVEILRDHPEALDDEAELHSQDEINLAPGDVPHPVLQGRPLHRNSGSNEGPDLVVDSSEQVNQHPIPDVDYPAKETFSVDSSSSVDQDFKPFEDKKSGEYYPMKEENRNADSDIDSPQEMISSDDGTISSSKAPSQRIRERLAGANRRRLHPSPMPNRQAEQAVSEDESSAENVQVNARSTRPPSRLESFQERFRQWKEKREPTVPEEYQNLRPSRIPQTRRVPPTERNYELVRRRPQRVTSRRPNDEEPEEASVPEPQSDATQTQNSQENNYETPTIGQPITLPENVLPERETNDDDSTRTNRLGQLRANRRQLQNRNRISNRRKSYQDAHLDNKDLTPENPHEAQGADARKAEESPQEHREMVPSSKESQRPPLANENINEDNIAKDAIVDDQVIADFSDRAHENEHPIIDQTEREGYNRRVPGKFNQNHRAGYDKSNPGNFDQNSHSNFGVNNRGDYEQNDREDYDNNNRGNYNQNTDEGYGENNGEDYDQNIRGDYDQNISPEFYEPPSYRPRAQYRGRPESHDYPQPESESQFEPPNDFRVSFPLPRNIGPSRPAVYGHHEQAQPLQDPIQVAESSRNNFQYSGHQPELEQRHQAGPQSGPQRHTPQSGSQRHTSQSGLQRHTPQSGSTLPRNFQYREDALASELQYDVPAVNQRPFRIYSPSPEGRHDQYSSAHPRPL